MNALLLALVVNAAAVPVEVSSGSGHTCARMSDGRVACWGNNLNGQIGDGTAYGEDGKGPENRPRPVWVKGLADARQLALGFDHSCALRAGGTVACWGSNRYGVVGGGDRGDVLVPREVAGLAGAVEIGASQLFTCARLGSGEVRCWGMEPPLELLDAPSPIDAKPTAVDGVRGATQLSVGARSACAIVGKGSVMCWGNNSSGELGDGTKATRTRAVSVHGITDATSLSVGNGYACALSRSKGLVCWGDLGCSGDKELVDPHPEPAAIGWPGATDVVVGSAVLCAKTSAWECVGRNAWGQIDPSAQANCVKRRALPISNAKPSLGQEHACVLASHEVQCWGWNYHGQLGSGAAASGAFAPTVASFSGL